jgi:hypothetical protein
MELMPTANSGSEVPNATTVAPIMKGGTLNFFPSSSAIKTKYSADFNRMTNATASTKNQNKIRRIGGIKQNLAAKIP